MKQYVFGYLFVRFAKLLAVLVVGIAILFTVSRLWQAKAQADAVQYASNHALGQRLVNLNASYRSTVDLLSHLLNKGATSAPSAPQFPRAVQSAGDFDTVRNGLAALTAGRSQIKQSVFERFETSIRQIESTLRTHAALIHDKESSPQPSVSPAPSNIRPEPPQSLFSKEVGWSEAQSRITELENAKKFLRVVERSAENPTNQQVLNASVRELDALQILLSSVPQPISNHTVAPSVTGISQPSEVDAEKIALRLSQLVASVRGAVLSAWSLDDALEATNDLAATEAAKRRAATLAVRSAWVNAGQQLMLVVFGLLLFAFMVCVVADVIQALMDTANNTRAASTNTSTLPSS